MKALLLVIALLVAGTGATAATKTPDSSGSPWRFNIFPINGELRYERDSTQQMVDRRPLNLALGVRKGPSTVILEYSKFSETSGNMTLSIDRAHEEYLLWWKQNILNFEYADFFISAGAGGYSEKVTTNLSGANSTTDTSGLQPMGGASAGVQSMLFRYVLVSFEGRLIAGKNFDPNPQAGMLLRLGVEF